MTKYYVLLERTGDHHIFIGWSPNSTLVQMYGTQFHGYANDICAYQYEAETAEDMAVMVDRDFEFPGLREKIDNLEILYRPLKMVNDFVLLSRFELDEIVCDSETIENYIDELRETVMYVLVMSRYFNPNMTSVIKNALYGFVNYLGKVSKYRSQMNPSMLELTEFVDPVALYRYGFVNDVPRDE